MEFMAWFIKFHELYEFLKVHRVTCPYSYSWVHEKFDIHVHEFMAMSVFIFMGSWIFHKLYSWVHKFDRYEIHKFMDIPIFIFMGSCFFRYSYS